jgi:tetratricopeptide (TPR) repeat protein
MMLRIWPSFLILPLILLAAASVAGQRDRDTYNPGNQSFEVSGQVNLSGTNEPALNIPVRLERFSGGLIDQINTDSRGRFRFPNLQRGYYRVVVNAPGFYPTQQDADVTQLFRIFLVFELAKERRNSVATLADLTDVVDARVPSEAREKFVQGRTALAKKNYQDAIPYLEQANAIYPNFFEAHLLLATALVDLRQWEKAEPVLQRALELKPENAGALISLGEVYWRQKRFKEAEETLLAGLKVDDKSWNGYFNLGRLYWDVGNTAKAGAAIGRTLQLKPDFAEAHLLAGNILLRVTQPERALAEYQEYLKLSPKGEFAPQTRELVLKLSKAIVDNQK